MAKQIFSFSLIILFSVVSNLLHSQSFEKIFTNSSSDNFKTLGGPTLSKTSDGNFLMLCDEVEGSSFWVAPGSMGLLKIDPNGNTLLQKALPESTGLAARLIPTSDNGFIITGSTASQGNAGVIKLDSSLNIEWKIGIGGSDYYYNRIVTIRETSDNNYIAVGTTGSYSNGQASIFLVKFNKQGTLIWGKSFGLGGDEDGMDVHEDNGDYYVVGYGTGYLGYTTSLFLKVSSNGALLFAKVVKGSWGGNTRSFLKKKDNSGFVLAISNVAKDYSNNTTLGDIIVIDMDKNATVNWAKKYDAGEMEDICNIQHTDNGYVLSGWRSNIEETSQFARRSQLFLLKTDESGNAQWFKTYMDTASYLCTADVPVFCMETQGQDKGYFLMNSIYEKNNTALGYNGAMLMLTKTDSEGNAASCSYSHNVTTSNVVPTITDVTGSIDILSGGTISTESTNFETVSNYGVQTLCFSTSISEDTKNTNPGITVYPNPFDNFTTFHIPADLRTGTYTFNLFDITGKEVYKANNINNDFVLDKGLLCPGIYYYRLTDQYNKSYRNKLVIK